MVTILLTKLALGPLFKWLLILTVWILATTYIVTEFLEITVFISDI